MFPKSWVTKSRELEERFYSVYIPLNGMFIIASQVSRGQWSIWSEISNCSPSWTSEIRLHFGEDIRAHSCQPGYACRLACFDHVYLGESTQLSFWFRVRTGSQSLALYWLAWTSLKEKRGHIHVLIHLWLHTEPFPSTATPTNPDQATVAFSGPLLPTVSLFKPKCG